ncbi:MAG: hypothetical protein HQ478_12475 [Chloroflexi bacterium]|nr:hypothetical protein [Chloroflexota bacterium]
MKEKLRGEPLPFDSLRMAPELAMAISDLTSRTSWYVVFDMEGRERIWDYFVPVEQVLERMFLYWHEAGWGV